MMLWTMKASSSRALILAAYVGKPLELQKLISWEMLLR